MGSNGKSKSETIESVQVIKAYRNSDNLFMNDFIRNYALSRNIYSTMKNCILHTQQMLNWKLFEKLGIAIKIPLQIHYVQKEALISYIKNNIDTNISDVEYFVYSANKNDEIKTKVSNLDGYVDGTDVTLKYKEPNGDIIETDLGHFEVDVDGDGVKEKYVFQTYDSGSNTLLSGCSLDGNTLHITLIKDNGNGTTDSDSTYKISIMFDDIKYIYVKYIDTDNTEHYIYIDDNDIIHTVETDYVLFFQYKNDGSYVNDKAKKIVFPYFGFSRKDTEDMFNDDNVKDVIFTYCTSFNDVDFSNFINQIYANIYNTIIFSNGMTTIEYLHKSSVSVVDSNLQYNFPPKEPTVKINGYKYSKDDLFLIGIDAINYSSGLNDKYKQIKKLFSIVGYSETTVKKKWYQTGLFNIALTIASIAMSPYSLGTSLVLFTSSFIVTNIAMQMFGKELGFVIGTIASLYIGSKITGTKLSLSSIKPIDVAKYSVKLTELYFKHMSEQVVSKIKEMQEEEKQLEEKISEIKKKSIYQPLDYAQSYYDNIYELPNLYYNNLYNYDRIYQQGVNI
jgi:hypothetical protein